MSGTKTEDTKQAIRVTQFQRAAMAYAASIPLLLLASTVGLVAWRNALIGCALIVVVNAVFFYIFNKELNKRFADRSLTLAQTLVAITLVMFMVYSFNSARSLMLVWLLVVLLFGVFRFNTREFIITALYMLLGYAAVINLLMTLKPETVDVYLEWYQWVWLGIILPMFALIGGRISELRAHLQHANQELVSALSTIQDMAMHDSLTGLPNRAMFNESLNHALARADRSKRPVGLLFIDLDHFKHVNDTLGHPYGDEVLREVARRLSEMVRESDLLARLGGDEFVLLVEDKAEPPRLGEIGEKLLAGVAGPIDIRGHVVNFTASIGVAVYPTDGRDVATLLANADLAMYQAKDRGRGRVCFFMKEMGLDAAERFAIEKALRVALERDEFRVFFQPKISMSTGRIAGVEALLRWQHPERGLLLPNHFITVAEETGLIVPIGLWTLRNACRRAKEWRNLGLPHISMAVNLSAAQFIDDELVKCVSDVLRETGLPANMLELEITESMLMKNPARAISIIEQLRKLGVRLAIDDFGTGYSSLAYLKQFPVDSLKVDRGFVRDLPHSRDDMAITRAVIAMAHSLNMRVIAEGVEQREQFDALRDEGCDEYQGFFYRPALSEDELVRMLRAPHAGPGIVPA